MSYKSVYMLLFSLVFQQLLMAQDSSLTLDQAVAITLENNLDIVISKNVVEASNNLATKGQAGYLPTVNINSSGSYSNSNTTLEFAPGIDPSKVTVDGAINTSLSAGLGLNYVVFNGFGRINTYKTLKSNVVLSELQSQVLAENSMLGVINTYLDILQTQQELDNARANFEVSRDRLRRTKAAVEVGAKLRLDLLNAEVDFNNDSLSVRALVNSIAKQKANLNVQMGRDPATTFSLSNHLAIPDQVPAELLEQALGNNATILMALINLEIAENSKDISKSRLMPTFSINANYGLQSSQNGAGIVLSQNTLGFNGGFNLSIPVYSGGQLNHALENANLSLQNSEIQLEKAKLAIRNEVLSADLDIQFVKSQISVLAQNVSLAELALNRAQLSYTNGQISGNDLRVAQLNLVISKNNLSQANMNLIRLYYAVSRLTGSLTSN